MATTNFIDGTTIVVADWLNDVDAHAYNQQTAAHSAANIAFTPAGTVAATNVQAAIAEVATDAATAITNLTATQVAYTPTGSVAATNVQTAIDEVVAETVQKTGDTGSAKMPAGTTAQRDGTPAAGWTRWNSTLGCNETYSGTEWIPEGWQYSTLTSLDTLTGHIFSGIPTWVNEIVLQVNLMSSSTTTNARLRLGHAGGLVTSAYRSASVYSTLVGTSTGIGSTTGVFFVANTATVVLDGQINIKRVAGNIWNVASVFNDRVDGVVTTSGWINVTAPLTQLELALASGVFDSGCSVNIAWRK